MRAPSTLDKGQWPPDYVSVFAWRQAQVLKLRSAEDLQFGAREYYRRHPVEFINHWCNTYDPRNAGGPTPPRMPFVLFQRQKGAGFCMTPKPRFYYYPTRVNDKLVHFIMDRENGRPVDVLPARTLARPRVDTLNGRLAVAEALWSPACASPHRPGATRRERNI